MTAPSTFVATGTWTNPDTSAAAGTISFRAKAARFVNNGNVVNSKTKTVTLDGSGTLGGGVTLIQATAGYTITETLVGRAVKTYHVAGTANIDLTPSTPSNMTVTGKWYTDENVLAAGTVEFRRISTGTVFVATLDGSGSLGSGIVIPQDAAGYVVTEKISGQFARPSYPIVASTSTLNLSTV